MKRTISLLLCFMMFASLSVLAYAEETNGDYIGMRFDLGENLPAGYVSLKISIYEDALRMTTSVANDAHAVFNCNISTSDYKYVAVMYRVTGDYSSPWFYMKDSSMANFAAKEGTYTAVGWVADAEWHKAVYNIETAFPAMVNKTVSGFRLPGGDRAGDTVDFKYICFFKTEEAANGFEGFPKEITTPEPETTVAETTVAETTSLESSAEVTEETKPIANDTTVFTNDTVEDETVTAVTESETETSAIGSNGNSNVDSCMPSKLKIVVIIFSAVIMLCAIALFIAYVFRQNVNKVFAATVAIILLACSFAIIIAFALI